MGRLQWTDDLSVGVDEIDAQHRKWIEYFNDAAEAVEAGSAAQQVSRTLGFLVDYTEEHFSTEERHMAESGYAGADEHFAKHNELRASLADLVRDFEEEGATHNLGGAVGTFLGNWLVKHIQEVDMSLGAFLAAQDGNRSGN